MSRNCGHGCRTLLPDVVRRVRQGGRFIVLYRSRPAFQIVPIDEPATTRLPLADDPLYHAAAVGRSTDGRSAQDHDRILYGR
jgi:antitoxin (DNA-binding transcriptional repressor) of toxin-antitoxin stability system